MDEVLDAPENVIKLQGGDGMKCGDCEYEVVCWATLKAVNKLKEGFCKQGRRKREYKEKKVVQPIFVGGVLHEKSGTDITVEKMLPVQ